MSKPKNNQELTKKWRRDFAISFVVGLALFFLVFNIVGAQDGWVACPQDQTDCGITELFQTVNNVLEYVITISSIIAAFLVAYAGWLYVSAGGDTSKIKQAHKIFFNTIVGFIIMLVAWLVVKELVEQLGANDQFKDIFSN